jgi:hypothetical protein
MPATDSASQIDSTPLSMQYPASLYSSLRRINARTSSGSLGHCPAQHHLNAATEPRLTAWRTWSLWLGARPSATCVVNTRDGLSVRRPLRDRFHCFVSAQLPDASYRGAKSWNSVNGRGVSMCRNGLRSRASEDSGNSDRVERACRWVTSTSLLRLVVGERVGWGWWWGVVCGGWGWGVWLVESGVRSIGRLCTSGSRTGSEEG